MSSSEIAAWLFGGFTIVGSVFTLFYTVFKTASDVHDFKLKFSAFMKKFDEYKTTAMVSHETHRLENKSNKEVISAHQEFCAEEKKQTENRHRDDIKAVHKRIDKFISA